MGLSYKQIGKKLGIDSHKEDVIQVFEAVGCNILGIKAPAKVSPPTPLWYLFESERELIKHHILPSNTDVKQLLPQDRLVERLGENAGFMLYAYLKVGEMVNEEIQSAMNGASSTSSIGVRNRWDGDMSSCIIRKVSEMQKSICQAAFQQSDYFECAEVGRCICSATKVLRFGWKDDPIPHPSFFWGCCRYTPVNAFKHDKGTPVRQSYWKVVGSDVKMGQMAEKNLKLLQEKTALAITYWDGREDNETDIAQANSLYGRPEEATPLKQSGQVVAVLQAIAKDLTFYVDQRTQANPTSSNNPPTSSNNPTLSE